MNKFVEKVGVSIASRLGITAAIAAIAAALLGGGYWWVKTQAPRETMKAKETGVKLDVEELAFYGDRDIRVDGKVYRPSETLGEPLPAIIYCQDKSYGESWCRSLAGTGALAYCFDFKGDGEKARVKELETALKGILKLRHVDPDKVYLLGEARKSRGSSSSPPASTRWKSAGKPNATTAPSSSWTTPRAARRTSRKSRISSTDYPFLLTSHHGTV